MKIHVLIVDDHKMFRDGLRMLIGKEEDMEVVGEAENGEEAIEVTRRMRPDVVIMDINMPKMDGITATGRILQEMPDTKVIAVTMHSDKSYLSRILGMGASKYVLKDNAFFELARAIREVAGNHAPPKPH